MELSAPGRSTVETSNRSATGEEGEPSHAGLRYGHSLWYRFTAPSDGTMVIDTEGSRAITALGVYTGSRVDDLAQVTSDGRDYGTAAVRFTARAGVTYSIAVDGSPGDLELSFAFDRPPSNDRFASPHALGREATASATGDTSFATHEQGEPIAEFNRYGSASVWYSWTAPSTGTATVDTAGSSFDTHLAAFAGDRLDQLTLFAQNDDATDVAPGGDTLTSRLKFHAEAGQTYRFAVDGSYRHAAGTVQLGLTLRPGPANDQFASARHLGNETTASAQDDSTLATREPGEPKHGWSFGDASLWYSWTAPYSGGLTIDTLDTSFNTVMAAYTGDRVDGLTRLGYNDDGVEDNAGSRIRMRVEAGTTYRFVVDGRQAKHAGLVKLRLSLAPPPANDAFASPLALPPLARVSQPGTNVGSTAESGEPGHGPEGGARDSTWYSWTAPSGGSLLVTVSSDFGAEVATYSGNSVGALVRAPLQAGSEPPDRIRLRVERGVTYRIAVGGPDDPDERAGNYTLTLALSDIPSNDDFADAVSLGSSPQLSIDGHNRFAGKEPGEPVHSQESCTSSVWYSWTAPGTSDVTLSAADSETDASLGIYTGEAVESLTWVPSTLTTTRFREVRTFRATKGTTYRFAVDGSCSSMGEFSVDLTSRDEPSTEEPPTDPPAMTPRPLASRPSPGPAPPKRVGTLNVPFEMTAAFGSQRLRRALRRGIRGRVTCSRSCRLRATAVVESPAGARRVLGGSQRTVARTSLRLGAGRRGTIVLRLSRRARRALSRVPRTRLKLRIAAVSGSEKRVLARRVRLGR